MSWGSLTFLYFLDFGGGGVEEDKLSLVGVLFLLEFGTLSAGHSESQITMSFYLPSFGLHWQLDGIMSSLRSNSCSQECVGSWSEPCSLTLRILASSPAYLTHGHIMKVRLKLAIGLFSQAGPVQPIGTGVITL